MSDKRKIEIFSAGCAACDETVETVKTIACPSCEIEVLDMHREDVAAKAKEYGIKSVPAVVIDGKLADCCAARGVYAEILKANGLGVPLG
jgi:glutaredoxin 3